MELLVHISYSQCDWFLIGMFTFSAILRLLYLFLWLYVNTFFYGFVKLSFPQHMLNIGTSLMDNISILSANIMSIIFSNVLWWYQYHCSTKWFCAYVPLSWLCPIFWQPQCCQSWCLSFSYSSYFDMLSLIPESWSIFNASHCLVHHSSSWGDISVEILWGSNDIV